jgi:hypothetical protein
MLWPCLDPFSLTLRNLSHGKKMVRDEKQNLTNLASTHHAALKEQVEAVRLIFFDCC